MPETAGTGMLAQSVAGVTAAESGTQRPGGSVRGLSAQNFKWVTNALATVWDASASSAPTMALVVVRVIRAEPNEIPVNQDLLGTVDLNLADPVSVFIPENINAFHSRTLPLPEETGGRPVTPPFASLRVW